MRGRAVIPDLRSAAPRLSGMTSIGLVGMWAAAVALIVLMCAIAVPRASAQGAADAEAYCATAGTAGSLGECQRRRLVEAEAELAAVFDRALKYIDAQKDRPTVHLRDWKRAMREAHRHWRAWVKQDCGPVVAWEMQGGSGTPAASWGCEVERVRARIDDLKSRYPYK